MTPARPGGVRRRLLHPLGPAVAIGVLTLACAAAARHAVTGSGALLACVAGYAAGFANSGST